MRLASIVLPTPTSSAISSVGPDQLQNGPVLVGPEVDPAGVQGVQNRIDGLLQLRSRDARVEFICVDDGGR
jgi:hypothetical protein